MVKMARARWIAVLAVAFLAAIVAISPTPVAAQEPAPPPVFEVGPLGPTPNIGMNLELIGGVTVSISEEVRNVYFAVLEASGGGASGAPITLKTDANCTRTINAWVTLSPSTSTDPTVLKTVLQYETQTTIGNYTHDTSIPSPVSTPNPGQETTLFKLCAGLPS